MCVAKADRTTMRRPVVPLPLPEYEETVIEKVLGRRDIRAQHHARRYLAAAGADALEPDHSLLTMVTASPRKAAPHAVAHADGASPHAAAAAGAGDGAAAHVNGSAAHAMDVGGPSSSGGDGNGVLPSVLSSAVPMSVDDGGDAGGAAGGGGGSSGGAAAGAGAAVVGDEEESGIEYFVKWKNLSYMHCTWSSEVVLRSVRAACIASHASCRALT
jgi:hypothetical protein